MCTHPINRRNHRNKRNNDVVSLTGHTAAETRPVFPAQTRCIKNVVNRKEALINDSTGAIKLPLWGDDIEKVKKVKYISWKS